MLNVKSETTAENTITITFPAETLENGSGCKRR